MELASRYLLFKRFHDFSAQANGVLWKLGEALFGSGFVDGSEDVE